jgi:deaminated glutathione amidase
MRPFAIAGLQLQLPAGDNVETIKSRIDATLATFPWVEMIVVSELAAFGPSTAHAQPMPGPAETAFAEHAKKHGIWLLPGTLFEKKDGKVYNTASVIDPSGTVVARYRKLFPFRPYELGVEPGEEFLVFDVPNAGRFGVSICYDYWFPETVRTLAVMGAEVILHPAMTTTIDREAELAIARASAVTNQVFVFDINGAGSVGNGRSIVVGPSGEVRHQAGTTEEIIPLEIDLEEVQRCRELGSMHLGQPLKSFRDRKVKFGIYGEGERHEYLDRLGPLAKPRRRR